MQPALLGTRNADGLNWIRLRSADEGILFPRRRVRPAAGEPFAAVAVVRNLIQMDE